MSAAIVRAIVEQHDATLAPWRAPLLIGLFGLRDAGKTTVARWLAARYPLVALSTDALRLRRATVLFDGLHLGWRDHDRLRALADDHAAMSALLYVMAESATIEGRLAARRDNAAETIADGKFVITPAHFARIAAWREPPDPEEEAGPIDTTHGTIAQHRAPFERW